MALSFPDQVREELQQLGSRIGDDYEKLISTLATCEPSRSPEAPTEAVAEAFGLHVNEARSVVMPLGALIQGYVLADVTADDFVNDLEQALIDQDILDAPDSANLARLVEQLLESDVGLGVGVKASAVANATGMDLNGARVISDLRPIFSDGDPNKVNSFVVVQTLHIEFHDGDARKQIELNISDDQLDILREVIDRAGKKKAALLKLIEDSGARHVA